MIHIADVGISLPSRIVNKSKNKEYTQNDNNDDSYKDDVVNSILNQTNSSTEASGAQLKDGVYEGSNT
ncbi:MAG: hypothetical protein Q4F06_00110 [Eubacteriales bacterium]|nr:hypothetical protein [Eubacteriales bacterium]